MKRRATRALARLAPVWGSVAVLALGHDTVSAERIPWSRGWSISATTGRVAVSGFSADLKRKMRRGGWGQTWPGGYDPIYGITFPASYYPKASRVGRASSFMVSHSILPKVTIAAGWYNADLGGQRGYDGNQQIEVTSTMSSLAVLVLAGDRFQLGGGPTIDWLSPNLNTRSTIGTGLTLQASYRFRPASWWFAGFVLAQHFGTSHEIGPYDAGAGNTFPAMKVSPANTSFGFQLGVRLVSE